jgi:flagellar FliL protein
MEDRIRTIVTQQVGTMTWLELRNPEGKIMLKYNLLKRINAVFPKPMVHNIYFTTFIMQQ